MKVHIGRLAKNEDGTFEVKNEAFCNELHQVCVTDHPAANKGVPKVVAYVSKESKRVAFIVEDSLQPADRAVVVEAVKEWQKV